MNITEFCTLHDACFEGCEWALATGCETMDELWQRDDMRLDWRLWIATRPGVLDDRTLRLFACWCARQVWHLLTDERSRHAVETAERYANGDATDEELTNAQAAAQAAAWTARAAGEAAAAALAAARASGAAWAAAGAARSAAWEDARKDQAEYLKNLQPNFSKGE